MFNLLVSYFLTQPTTETSYGSDKDCWDANDMLPLKTHQFFRKIKNTNEISRLKLYCYEITGCYLPLPLSKDNLEDVDKSLRLSASLWGPALQTWITKNGSISMRSSCRLWKSGIFLTFWVNVALIACSCAKTSVPWNDTLRDTRNMDPNVE